MLNEAGYRILRITFLPKMSKRLIVAIRMRGA